MGVNPDEPTPVFHVLVVDDDPVMRCVIELLFEEEPYVSVSGHAASAEEALALARTVPDRIDLVVLDHVLAGPATGLELAPWLRRACPRARLVLFSATVDSPAYRHPAVDAAVPKSDPELLVPTARRLLGLPLPRGEGAGADVPAPARGDAGAVRGRVLTGAAWAAAAAVVAALVSVSGVLPSPGERLLARVAGSTREGRELNRPGPSAGATKASESTADRPSGTAVTPRRSVTVEPHLVLERLNAERVGRGLAPVGWDAALAATAQAWADHLAVRHGLARRSPAELAGAAPPGWRSPAEVVGAGSTATDVLDALVGSPEGRAVLLGVAYPTAGVGVSSRSGTWYVVLTLAQPQGAPPAAVTGRPEERRDGPRPAPQAVERGGQGRPDHERSPRAHRGDGEGEDPAEARQVRPVPARSPAAPPGLAGAPGHPAPQAAVSGRSSEGLVQARKP